MTPKLQDLQDRLAQICAELDHLSHEAEETASSSQGAEFSGQNQLSAILEVLVFSATHEIATTLGFIREDIAMTAKLIDFRRNYSILTGDDLESIIDHSRLNDTLKKQFLQMGYDKNEIVALPGIIQDDWRQLFGNESYARISEKLHRHIDMSARQVVFVSGA